MSKTLKEELFVEKNQSGISTPLIDDQGFKSFKRKFFKSNESLKYKNKGLDGSLDKKLKSGKKKKKESIREAIDMKKKNCLHFGIISQNVAHSKNINLTQRFKTPRDDDKKK